MKHVDLVVIGGGPAGMAAAVSAREHGVEDILILERDTHLGGILQQCIHNGFGLHRFKEELTGPEYAWRYEQRVREMEIPVKLGTMVLHVDENKVITATNEEDGVFQIEAGAIVLAMGCRERSRGALNIAGSRPAGIYTAGAAQRFVNIRGCMPGKRMVLLGSGDIGLIMARRMTWEGGKVEAVCELMPYSGGLTRNIVQCLQDNDIPLYLSTTIIKVHGTERVEGVTVAEVDENRRPKPETARFIPCDTVLLSCGLIPENELTKEAGIALDAVTSGAVVDQFRATSLDGVFACGNVLHVHDLVDYVSEEAEIAGAGAARYLAGRTPANGNAAETRIPVRPQNGVRYSVPQQIDPAGGEDVTLYFRVADVWRDVTLKLTDGDRVLVQKKRPKVAPGEMETLVLKTAMLGELSGGPLALTMERKEG